MTKKEIKSIREIANRLPIVYEQTVSGFYMEEGKYLPNIVNHPVNHERRIRKAYERLGMDGVRGYLDMIIKLQKQRHENFVNDGSRDSGGQVNETEAVDTAVSDQQENILSIDSVQPGKGDSGIGGGDK